MAEQLTVGELVYKISGDMDNLKTELAKAETEIGKLRSSMDQTSQSSDSMSSMLGKAATVVKTFATAFIVKQIVDFGRAAVDMASQQLEQQTKLYQVLRTSQNATDDQIKSLISYAGELENVGVISKDVTLASMAQLATYDLSTESIKELTPSLLDYLAAEKGANATKEDAISVTNGLAQAIQGNFASLTKSGFILDEATKKVIEHGTQEERITAITEVLDSTYKDYNKTLAGTFLGTQVKAQNIVEDFTADLGFALMPAIQNVTGWLIEQANGLAKNNSNFEAGTERINTWGKYLYQTSNFVIAFIKAIVLTVKSVIGLGDTIYRVGALILNFAKDSVSNVLNIQKQFTTMGEALVKLFKGDFQGALDTFKNHVTSTFADTTSAWNDFTSSQDYWSKQISASFDDVNKSIQEGLNATDFKPVTASALAAYDAMKKPVDSFGASGDKAKKAADDLGKFQDKLLDIVKASQDVTKELEGDLAKSFKEFGDNIKSQIAEGTTGLAQIVVDAQKKITELDKQIAASKDDANADALKARETLNEKIAAAELALSDRLRKVDETSKTAQKQRDEAQLLHKRALADAQADYAKSTTGIDTTGADKLSELKAQQAEQQKILDSAAGYAERQATFIAGIREKLTGAGIDISTTGLDGILKSQSLQEQIDELNRQASLNAFQLFEEEQNKKLTILTNNFIAESTLISQKIIKQKAYEEDLTLFFTEMNATRLKDTDAWAQATIAKYGQVAQALENIISLQARAGQVAAMNAAQASNGQSNGGTTNNSSTVNAPITINASNATQIDYSAIARQIGFQTSHQ